MGEQKEKKTPNLEKVREIYSRDRFATETTGAVIEAVEDGYCRCTLMIDHRHDNAFGKVQGGAIYTLGDLALGIAMSGEDLSYVGLQTSIQYIHIAKGTQLIAEARIDKKGHKMAFVTVDVTDDLGTLVAKMSAVGYRVVE